MMFIAIGVILIVILIANRFLDSKKFISEVQPYFKFLMEDDYEFLLSVRYGQKYSLEKKFKNKAAVNWIFKKDKEYDEAIRICNKAIEDLGYFSKDRFEKWNTNLERVIKLKEKEINK